MRRSNYVPAILTTMMLALLISGIGCAKKAPAPPPAPPDRSAPPEAPPAPEPMINLDASPSAIQQGQSATLTWKSSNATGVTIDNGVGTVEPSGRRSISPEESTTYKATATGPGGSAIAEARVTVTAPPAVTPPPESAISDEQYFDTNMTDAFFDYDSYSIRPDARSALIGNARALKERPGIRITIEGHCDERGSERYNLALGDRRANAAKEFLVSQGIDASRINIISYGEERAFCEESDEECWQLNRRAYFVMR